LLKVHGGAVIVLHLRVCVRAEIVGSAALQRLLSGKNLRRLGSLRSLDLRMCVSLCLRMRMHLSMALQCLSVSVRRLCLCLRVSLSVGLSVHLMLVLR
jgi:hypothetical protein